MSSTTFVKRQKELQRQQKQRDKLARREERNRTKGDKPADAGGEDPDIAHIVPGPQPIPEEEGEL
ncbi:hypothetical protein BH09MYX1_BH09MYX1_63370 [soil metagenome]